MSHREVTRPPPDGISAIMSNLAVKHRSPGDRTLYLLPDEV